MPSVLPSLGLGRLSSATTKNSHWSGRRWSAGHGRQGFALAAEPVHRAAPHKRHGATIVASPPAGATNAAGAPHPPGAGIAVRAILASFRVRPRGGGQHHRSRRRWGGRRRAASRPRGRRGAGRPPPSPAPRGEGRTPGRAEPGPGPERIPNAKASRQNKLFSVGMSFRRKTVIPVAVELVPLERNTLHLLRRYRLARRVIVGVQLGTDRQPVPPPQPNAVVSSR